MLDNGIIKRFLSKSADKLRKEYQNVSATGKTVRSIGWSYSDDEQRGRIYGGGWLPYVDLGRGQKGSGTSGYYYKSEGSLIKALKQWMDARGIFIPPLILARSINVVGTQRYQTGQDLGILRGFTATIKDEMIDLQKQLGNSIVEKLSAYYAQRMRQDAQNKVLIIKRTFKA